jgi:uncharacterized GH25 family protein
MKRNLLLAGTALLLAAGALRAHDLFLKLQTYFLEPDRDVSVSLLNGTFEGSENPVSRDRMADVRIVGPADQVQHPPATSWHDDETTSFLDFRTGAPGTYVIGVSTRPRMIELSAEDFNDYLEHDGVLDVLEARERDGELDKPAREKYSKHVKAVVQVGRTPSGSYTQRLRYPVELVPLTNPTRLRKGDHFEVLFLRDGVPIPNHLIYASHEGYRLEEDGASREAVEARTDDFGVFRLELTERGRWYIRLIHMERSQEEGVDYESNWATLTFEVR